MAIDTANDAAAARFSATAATIAASSSFETGAFQLLLAVIFFSLSFVVTTFAAATTTLDDTGGGGEVGRDSVEQIRQHRFLCVDFIHCTDPYASRYFIRPHGPLHRLLMSDVGGVTAGRGSGGGSTWTRIAAAPSGMTALVPSALDTSK